MYSAFKALEFSTWYILKGTGDRCELADFFTYHQPLLSLAELHPRGQIQTVFYNPHPRQSKSPGHPEKETRVTQSASN